jgi:uncharacterized damage-inducible protein DinB
MKKLTTRVMFALLAFFAVSICQAQVTMDEFAAKWESSRQFTLETVDKMPDDLLDYKPHPTAMSFKEQITHVAAAIAGLSKGFMLGGDMDFDPQAKPQTKAELNQFIDQCYAYGKKTFSSLSEAQLSEEIDSFAGKVTRRQMLGLIDDHATHHRGAAVSYIRANGIEPPAFRGL